MASSKKHTNPWGSWSTHYATSSTASFQVHTQTWGSWNSCICTTANTWPLWNDEFVARASAANYLQAARENVLSGRVPSQGEILARAEKEKADAAIWAEQRRRYAEQESKRVAEASAARRRAGDLLYRSLTPEQREDLAKKDCFYLESVAANGERRRYRIDRGTHGNVALLDAKGSVVGTFCVQPNDVPVEDAMLAQKLWIETDPEAFRRVANFTPRRTA